MGHFLTRLCFDFVCFVYFDFVRDATEHAFGNTRFVPVFSFATRVCGFARFVGLLLSWASFPYSFSVVFFKSKHLKKFQWYTINVSSGCAHGHCCRVLVSDDYGLRVSQKGYHEKGIDESINQSQKKNNPKKTIPKKQSQKKQSKNQKIHFKRPTILE